MSNAQRALPLCDIMSILLSIPEHKPPGTTGVRGRLYKLHANVLGPVFQEAFDDLTAGGAAAPAHLTDFIWLAVPKQQGADSIKLVRDLELPNEDAKVLGRMFSKILDDAGASQLRRFQQAFVSGGQIERNVIGIAEAIASAQHNRHALRFLLFLDCSKGFNMLSWEWVRKFLQAASLNPMLIEGIERLMHQHVAYLSMSGYIFEGVTFCAG